MRQNCQYFPLCKCFFLLLQPIHISFSNKLIWEKNPGWLPTASSSTRPFPLLYFSSHYLLLLLSNIVWLWLTSSEIHLIVVFTFVFIFQEILRLPIIRGRRHSSLFNTQKKLHSDNKPSKKWDMAFQSVFKHDPVCHERINRILEGGWLVLLQEKMRYPC